jgi:hypothetical protein
MRKYLVPVVIAGSALALAVVVFAAGGLVAASAFASGSFMNGPGGPWMAGRDHGAWAAQLPPELKGLGDIPAADRFGHFKGATVNLTDKNNQPLTVTVTPGTVSAASATSLTMNANDGSTKTYALDDKTIERGQSAPTANEKVVVVTLNGSSTATAVMAAPNH